MSWWSWLIAWGAVASLWAQEPKERWLGKAVALFEQAYSQWAPERWAPAEQFLRSVEPHEPQDRPVWLYWLGVIRFHALLGHQARVDPSFEAIPADQLEAVQSVWDELLRLDPFHAEAHAVTGTLWGMRVGRSPWRAIRWGPAIQRHQRMALQWGGDNPRVLYLRGAALAKVASNTQSLAKAAEVLRKAEERFKAEAVRPALPGEPRWGYGDCLTFLGEVEERLGRIAEAQEAYQRALQVHPGHPMARYRLARLRAKP